MKVHDPGDIVHHAPWRLKVLGEVGDKVTQGGDGWHDERQAVVITELDVSGYMLKMISCGAWTELVRCQLVGCLL